MIDDETLYNKRLVDETPKAYYAFTLFLNLGISRSINLAYAEYLKQRQKDGQAAGGKRTAPRHWEAWSSAHDWQIRAAAFDADLQEKLREAAEAEHLEQLRAFSVRRLAAARRLEAVFEKLIGRVEARSAAPDEREGTTAALARAAAAIGTAAADSEAMFLGVDQLYQRLLRDEERR